MVLKCEICGGKDINGSVQYFKGRALHAACKGRQETLDYVHGALEAMPNSTEAFMLLDRMMRVLGDNRHLALNTDAGRLLMALELVKEIRSEG